MRTFEYTSSTALRTITTSADETTAALAASDGVAATPHTTHTVFEFTGGLTSADATPYWYSEKRDKWLKGDVIAIAGDVPVEVKHRGRRTTVLLTNITKTGADIQVDCYQHGAP